MPQSRQANNPPNYLTEQNTREGGNANPYVCLFLAMAHHRLGHAADAKQWLDKALRECAESVPNWSWDNKLRVNLLRREAETLITGKPAEGKK
jgi:hypothetical protein